MEDVRELVPERHAEVERLLLRAHGSEGVPEAHALDFRFRQPARANGEVLPFGVELDADRRLGGEAVVFDERLPRAFEERRDVAFEHGPIALVIANREAGAGHRHVVLGDDLFEELEGVEDADVERVE